MKTAKVLVFASVMAALANVLSVPPLAIPIAVGPFETTVHFSQLPIFLAGMLAGPAAGLITGFVGGLYTSFTIIPFIVGGLAILGCAAGLFAKKINPFFSGILAWCVQAPFVAVTDYIWFAFFMHTPQAAVWAIVTPIMVKLTVESVIAAFLALVVVRYVRRSGISF